MLNPPSSVHVVDECKDAAAYFGGSIQSDLAGIEVIEIATHSIGVAVDIADVFSDIDTPRRAWDFYFTACAIRHRDMKTVIGSLECMWSHYRVNHAGKVDGPTHILLVALVKCALACEWPQSQYFVEEIVPNIGARTKS
jgi:hypothetical protein